MIETAAPRLATTPAGKPSPMPGTAKDSPESPGFAALLALGLPQTERELPLDARPAGLTPALQPRDSLRQASGKSLPGALPELPRPEAQSIEPVGLSEPEQAADSEVIAEHTESGIPVLPGPMVHFAPLAGHAAPPVSGTVDTQLQHVAPPPAVPVSGQMPAPVSHAVPQSAPQPAGPDANLPANIAPRPAPHGENTVVRDAPQPLSAEQDRAQRQAFVWRLALPSQHSRAAGPAQVVALQHRAHQAGSVPSMQPSALPPVIPARERVRFTDAAEGSVVKAPRGDVAVDVQKLVVVHSGKEPRDAALRLAPLVLADFAQSAGTVSALSAPVQTVAAPLQTVPQAPAQFAPHDLSALVDRLVEAREALVPRQIEAAIAHAEFGRVGLQFRHDDGGLSVSMASADPGFAQAAQVAAINAPAAMQTGSDALPQRQEGGGQATSAQPQARQDSSGQSAPRDSRSANHTGEEPRNDTPRAAQDRERRKGIYA